MRLPYWSIEYEKHLSNFTFEQVSMSKKFTLVLSVQYTAVCILRANAKEEISWIYFIFANHRILRFGCCILFLHS